MNLVHTHQATSTSPNQLKKQKRILLNSINTEIYFWNTIIVLYFQKTKPTWTLQEGSVFSFCWKASDIKNLIDSVRSTEYQVPNGNRWRGLLTIKGSQHHLSLQLVSSVTPVVVGARYALNTEKKCLRILSLAIINNIIASSTFTLY